ncbi:MAG TPA: TIGR01777 family oxidoreductase [Anaerolineales bacterium]
MKILIAGSHGMIGSAVTRTLGDRGHEIVRLVRHAPGDGELYWDPDGGRIDARGLEGFDAVIQLASMPWPMRWTEKAKQKMCANRSATYRLLADALAACASKPHVLVCASGIGVYPPSDDEVITEETAPCSSFLSAVDREGETATASAEAAGIRVVHLRIPPVVGGAALQRIGFQGGDGRQWMSWVGLDELPFIIEFTLTCEALSGPVNAVSPNPLRAAEFATTARRALGQKPGGTMPAWVVRIVLGEMGEEFVLASRRVQPARLLAAGYRFHFPDLECALRHEKEVVGAGLTSKTSLVPS